MTMPTDTDTDTSDTTATQPAAHTAAEEGEHSAECSPFALQHRALVSPARDAFGSAQWIAYFRHNRALFGELFAGEPGGVERRGPRLTDHERRAIADSIAEFQLGESGEGLHLMRCAKLHAAAIGDPHYVEALGLFIAEEQRHARDLGAYMDAAGIPRVRHAWPDTVFRFLRHRAGLELSILVLVTAEVVAQVYYAALRDATDCPRLRALCDRILRDEDAHVRFQTERLAILRRAQPRWRIRLAIATHRVLFFGTGFVVWHKHGRTMRYGGWSFRRFRHELEVHQRSALERSDPRWHGPSAFRDLPRLNPRS